MKRVFCLVVLVLSVFCSQCIAAKMVQMHDDFSLQTVLQRYNQYVRNNVNDDSAWRYMVSESPIQLNEELYPNTTAWMVTSLQSVSLVATLNGNGKVVNIVVYAPITHDKTENAKYAYRLLCAIDCKNRNEQLILDKCARAVAFGEPQFYYSATEKRSYYVNHNVRSDGHYTYLAAFVD